MQMPRLDLMSPALKASLLTSLTDGLDDPELLQSITVRARVNSGVDLETGVVSGYSDTVVNALRREVSRSEITASEGRLGIEDRVYLIDAADFAASALLSSYALTNKSVEVSNFYSGGVEAYGQSFQVDRVLRLTTLRVMLEKVGSPTDDVIASLYATTGTHGTNAVPTGAALATSAALNAADLPTDMDAENTDFEFASGPLLYPGVTYGWAVLFPYGDVSNRISIGYDNSAPTADGNRFQGNGVTWSSSSSGHVFEVYGTFPLDLADQIVDGDETFDIVGLGSDPLDHMWQIMARASA